MRLAKPLVIAAVALTSVGALAANDDVDAIPWLKASGRDAYKDKYLAGQGHKAFAIAKSGGYGWSTGKDSARRAAQFALYNCQKGASERCFLYSVDAERVLDAYQTHGDESAKALASLHAPAKPVYADEDKDAGVAPLEGLKSGNLHEATPTASPHAKTLTTAKLVEMLSAPSKPVVLDVLAPTDAFRRNGIPSSIWVSGAGAFDAKANASIGDYLAKFMGIIAPSKNSPIVVYCLSWECWLSYNAIDRLADIGYTNLYWYRGGIESWQRAGLPTVEEPLAAEVY